MITSLDEAWSWYQSAKEMLQTTQRLGLKHWNDLPWTGPLGQDNRLRHLEATHLIEKSKRAAEELDDLGVFLLFSIFEAEFRGQAQADLAAQRAVAKHPVMQHAARTLLEAVRKGPLVRVLAAYKPADPNLVEEVNQVRKYRNWIVHGRRREKPTTVTPEMARDRLQRFLTLLASQGEAAAAPAAPSPLPPATLES